MTRRCLGLQLLHNHKLKKGSESRSVVRYRINIYNWVPLSLKVLTVLEKVYITDLLGDFIFSTFPI